MNDLKSKSNIKLMKRVLTTYELRKYLKKYFCLTLDNYLVLAYLDVFKNDEGVKSRLLCKMLYNVFTISTYQN